MENSGVINEETVGTLNCAKDFRCKKGLLDYLATSNALLRYHSRKVLETIGTRSRFHILRGESSKRVGCRPGFCRYRAQYRCRLFRPNKASQYV
jgi:hypothetical protein